MRATLRSHEEHAEEFEGVVDVMLTRREVIIAMFHNDEVNEESVLLANWSVHPEGAVLACV